MATEKMCAHCGETPAVTLRIAKEDPDLDGMGVGWHETLKVLEDNDIGDDPDFYVINRYCSGSCIHLTGEFNHAMAEDKD
jgi:hypothetical protein